MARPHSKAARSVEVVSSSSAEQLANLAKQAADETRLHLDQVAEGRLVFSVRPPLFPAKRRLLVCELRLSQRDDAWVMRSRITSYRTSQMKFMGLIPIGPRHLVGLATYERFMRRFGELVAAADAGAAVSVTG
jgi:hypothetical protein